MQPNVALRGKERYQSPSTVNRYAGVSRWRNYRAMNSRLYSISYDRMLPIYWSGLYRYTDSGGCV